MDADPKRWRVGLVGYGEVGRILAEDLRERGVAVHAYDLKLDGEAVSDKSLVIPAGRTVVVQAGKRRFARVTVS